jgi:hypothetical protein
MNGIRVVQKLFEEYFRATVPRLAAHLDQQGMPLSIATTKWFMCLYVNTLPAETLLRVWDVLLVDGPEVLLRVGAALLKLNEPSLLTITDFIALSQELQSLGKGCWSADALLSVAYKQLASPPAARLALATLRRMQLVAHEVGGEAADGVYEVRLREGLIPRTLRVGWLRPHRPLPVVPPTKLPPTSGDADAAQGSASATASATPDLNSPTSDAKEWLKQRAAERAAAASVAATALPQGPVDDGAGVGFESPTAPTAPGSRMLRPLARRVERVGVGGVERRLERVGPDKAAREALRLWELELAALLQLTVDKELRERLGEEPGHLMSHADVIPTAGLEGEAEVEHLHRRRRTG